MSFVKENKAKEKGMVGRKLLRIDPAKGVL